MLLSKSEELQLVACRCIIAFVLENLNNQLVIAKENTIEILLKLLKSEKTGLKVVQVIVQTIATLCVDVAMVNNEKTQLELMDKGVIDILVPILENPPNKTIQIETAIAIACLLLANPNTEDFVNNKLDLKIFLDLMDQDEIELRLNAGRALTTLAYNNTKKQIQIKELGGISFSLYENILESRDEMQVCKASFQVIVGVYIV
jgi:hypothetical protein